MKIPDARGEIKKKILNAEKVVVADCYTVDAKLTKEELEVAKSKLINPRAERLNLKGSQGSTSYSYYIEVGYLPGVTDNVGNTATEMIGHKCYHSQIFYINSSPLKVRGAWGRYERELAGELYNPLIQRVAINSKLSIPRVILPKPHEARIINLDVSDTELMVISKQRMLALDLAQMRAIRDYKKNPTDVELEALAQTWSEHCKHTIFADPIDEIKDGLYKHYIQGATKRITNNEKRKSFCVSVFKDNSGAIVFDKDYLVTHKVETHNTPSALDPFGGAITGIGGVNRDAIGFGLGAKPIANTYGFCLGYPDDKRIFYRDADLKQPMLSARRIMDGVIAGINAGGNQAGIPTPQGFLYFDDRYRGKPLVFAGTVGLIPRKIKGKLSHIKKALPGDHIVMVGGRVGQDGMRGAMFASEEIHAHSSATAVQIGDPITQKKFSDAIVKEARDQELYDSITDNGAGGLSGSVGEMAKESGGCEVELDKVPLKYPGLEPWQIWISESQERMTLAIPPKNWKKFHDLMLRRGVEATVIGKFTKSGKCVVKYHGKTVMDLEMEFLHNGRPIRLQSTKHQASNHKQIQNQKSFSFKFISEQYDNSVQGTSVIGPLQGKGQINGNATVLAPVLGSKRGIVLTQALAPEMTETDPYGMAVHVVESAIRHAVAIGADPDYIALLDNFCWCSSDEPERLWQLKEACRGCYDAAVANGTPFISGKDSMFNDFKGFDEKGKPIKISALPTLLISAIGVIPDVTKTVTEDFKSDGDLIYLLSGATAQYRAYYKAVQRNLIASAISVGRGGIEVALAKAAIGGMLGTNVELRMKNDESIIISVTPKNKKAFEKIVSAKLVGTVTADFDKEAYNAYHETFKNY